MIEFTLNDESIDFFLNAEIDAIPAGDILMGSTTVFWGDTVITFAD